MDPIGARVRGYCGSSTRVSSDVRTAARCDHELNRKEAITVRRSEDINRRVRRTALITVALSAALAFGILVLARGDWIPGAITVVAALVGLARQIPVIRDLHGERRRASAPQPSDPARPVPAPGLDDGSHTPPHGDALVPH